MSDMEQWKKQAQFNDEMREFKDNMNNRFDVLQRQMDSILPMFKQVQQLRQTQFLVESKADLVSGQQSASKSPDPGPSTHPRSSKLSDDEKRAADEEIKSDMRQDRADDVRSFTDSYTFAQGEKICIPYRGEPIFCMSDKCFESTWVAVHGMRSICMVICKNMRDCLKEQNMGLLFKDRDCLKDKNTKLLAKAVISEVECIRHKDVDFYVSDFHLLASGSVEKPFAVVSVGLGTFEETGYVDSRPPHCCVYRTLKFLESCVSSELLDTDCGTEQAAIKAYQLMCNNKLTAEDISVSIMDTHFGRFQHIIFAVVGEHLDIINGLSSA